MKNRMTQSKSSKKKKVLSALVLAQLFVMLFCFWEMGGEKEKYQADEQIMHVYGGSQEAGGNYYIDENTVLDDDVFLVMELPDLKKGVYEVQIKYDTNAEQVSRVLSDKAVYRKLSGNAVSLRPSNMQKEVSYRFMLFDKVDDLRVEVLYNGTGKLKITDLEVVHTRQEYSMGLFFVFLISLSVDIFLFFFICSKEKIPGKAEKKVLFGLFVIFLLSCANLLTDYTHLGDDAFFHLNRIEGIAREWTNGNFPARLESYCMFGMGYPMSVMYPEVFLWPAVFLRMIGFDLSFSMKAEIALINIMTTILSYYSFKNIFKSRQIGLWGSAVYTLSLYRLYNIYGRAAVGEYIAMTFLPLICWGLTRVFSEKEEVVREKKTVLLLAFGYMGILYSHVLSLELAIVFTILLCLFLWRRFFRKATFFTFVKAGCLAIGLSLWFLIPFVDYSLNADLNVFKAGNPIQKFGLYLTQLFWFFPQNGEASYMYVTGMQYVSPYGMGLALAVVLFCFLYFRIKGIAGKEMQDFEEYPKVKIAAIMGILAMFMSLSIFPWDAVSEFSEGFKKIIYSIQFPYRFLMIVTISLTFLGCGLLAVFRQERNGKKGTVFSVSILILTVWGSSFYMNHEIQGRIWSDFREAAAMGSAMIGNGEYLPAGTDVAKLSYTEAVAGEGVVLRAYTKINNHVEFWCEKSGSAESFVECNLLYYPGYRALNGDTMEELEIVRGENNVLRVKIPSGFKGNVVIDFVGKSYWKIGNILSLILWLGVIGSSAAVYYKRSRRMEWISCC